ncbi:MAG: PHP domain-containing protein [Candidatus Eremiobacteraeota bacterium]|nr:PHP domain-containing protein [Candidatus Eremiobacteraeota bacterium]
MSTAELVTAMEQRGVGIFSITDHDTTRAYGELPKMRAKIIPGIEINTTTPDGVDIHVLGYGFDPASDTPIAQLLEKNRTARRTRIMTMIERLRKAGYPLTEEMVIAEADGSESLGRPHVAKALVRSGMVKDVQTVFEDLVGRGGPGFVPSAHISAPEAIEAIAQAGGVPVFAHPGRLSDYSVIDAMAERGIVGLEVFYPTHTPVQTAHFRGVAERLGLVMTAGSDFHDARWKSSVVGVDVEEGDIAPFLELLGR